MKTFMDFCLILTLTLGTLSYVIAQDIIITAQDIATISANETPNWIHAYDKEVRNYNYTPNQSSLTILRATGLGNCVALAKCGAWHALQDGFKCRLIGVADSNNHHKHMFLYATKDDITWAVSNKSRREVYSISDAIIRMSCLGSQIVIDQTVTPDNIDHADGSYLRITISRMWGLREPEGEEHNLR